MKRRLQIIAIYATALLALRLMAQDTGAGAGGGDSSGGAGAGTVAPDTSGEGGGAGGMGTGGEGVTTPASGEGNSTNGETTPSNGEGTLPQSGASQGQGGNGTGGLMEPNSSVPAGGDNGNGGAGSQYPEVPPPEGGGTGLPGSLIVPPGQEGAPPGSIVPAPGTTTPEPTPVEGGAAAGAGTQTPPVSFTLPGGYGGSPGQTFTLGQGRFSKPPVTFSLSVQQGYDDNLFDAPNHAEPTPTPAPIPPLQERRVVNYIIGFPFTPPIPVYQSFTVNARATPTPIAPLGKEGSAVTSVTLGAQIQMGNPRTVLTSDASVSALNYWDRPGGKIDYNGSFDLNMVHRLTPRASLSISTSFTYQKTPDFALINAPTTNGGSGGEYLNGDFHADLSYTWSSRISTVTSYDLGLNISQSNSSQDLAGATYGTQVRYEISSRNTVTADVRFEDSSYSSNASADNTSQFYLIGLDSVLSSRLRNTVSVGIQNQSYTSGGVSQLDPYLESATTLALPRGAAVVWTNRVGAENSGAANEKTSSYRTGLSYSQPLSTKLGASVSLSYNNVRTTDTTDSAGSITQNQFQGSFSLGYSVSARLSLSLSYSLTDLQSNQTNGSYERQQIFLGGSYTFQ